jgi:hypothetical protein
MKTLSIALAAASSLAASVSAAPPPAAPGAEASIPFVRFGGIQDFEARGDDIVYLQDRSRRWYRAQLNGPCLDLGWATAIGIDTHGSPTFDRFSALIVEGRRCPIQSLTLSGPPPKRHHGKQGS